MQLLKASSDGAVTVEAGRDVLLRGRKNSCRHSRSSMVPGIGSHGLWLMCRSGSGISRQECQQGY